MHIKLVNRNIIEIVTLKKIRICVDDRKQICINYNNMADYMVDNMTDNMDLD